MSPVEFEPTIPAGERPQTYALDRAATGIGDDSLLSEILMTPRCTSNDQFPYYILLAMLYILWPILKHNHHTAIYRLNETSSVTFLYADPFAFYFYTDNSLTCDLIYL